MSLEDIKKGFEKNNKNELKGSNSIIYDFDVIISLGEEVNSITEFGVRKCFSTYAWLLTEPKSYLGVDIKRYDTWDVLEEDVKGLNTDFKLLEKDDSKITIPKTELLFIDSLHTREHLRTLLFKHNEQVEKYIVIHDITKPRSYSNYVVGEVGIGRATKLNKAVEVFLKKNKDWKRIKYKRPCGLVILKRV